MVHALNHSIHILQSISGFKVYLQGNDNVIHYNLLCSIIVSRYAHRCSFFVFFEAISFCFSSFFLHYLTRNFTNHQYTVFLIIFTILNMQTLLNSRQWAKKRKKLIVIIKPIEKNQVYLFYT